MPKVKKTSGGFQYATKGGKAVGGVKKTRAAAAKPFKGKKK